MPTSPSQELWTQQQVIAHLQRHQPALLKAGMPALKLTNTKVSDLSDGNINQVFRVTDGQHSVIVKHAPPFLRVVGPSWPLSTERNTIEVSYLRQAQALAPGSVPRIYGQADATVVMEDLKDHTNVRYTLMQQQCLPKLGADLGRFMATLAFHTSCFAQPLAAVTEARKHYHNPDPCKITEDLFFTDPYQLGASTNRFSPALQDLMTELATDTALHNAVNALKKRFLTCPDTECSLIHGDLHTGSVLATTEDTKVLDGEFACYGPVGFDVGTVLANLILNHAAQSGLSDDAEQCAHYQAYLRQQMQAVWTSFVSHFTSLATAHTKADVQTFLTHVWQDALGYAGTECIRRTVGLAHVADIEKIARPDRKTAAETQSIHLGRLLIKEAKAPTDEAHEPDRSTWLISCLIDVGCRDCH